MYPKMPRPYEISQDANDLLRACLRGDLIAVKYLSGLVNPSFHGSRPLRVAASKGHLEIVEFLIPLCNPKADESGALFDAAGAGHLDVVNCLLPHSDPKARQSLSLQMAVIMGYEDVVDVLLPVSDPSVSNGAIFWSAVQYGTVGMVKKLASLASPDPNDASKVFLNLCKNYPKSKQSEATRKTVVEMLIHMFDCRVGQNGSRALCYAAQNGEEDLFNLLYPLSNPSEALLTLKSSGEFNEDALAFFENHQKSFEEKKKMTEELSKKSLQAQKTPKKKI